MEKTPKTLSMARYTNRQVTLRDWQFFWFFVDLSEEQKDYLFDVVENLIVDDPIIRQ